MLLDDVSRLAGELFATRMNSETREFVLALDQTSAKIGSGGPLVFNAMRQQGADALRSLHARAVESLKESVEKHDVRWYSTMRSDLFDRYSELVQHIVGVVRADILLHSRMFGGADQASLDPVLSQSDAEARNAAATLFGAFVVERKTDAARKRREFWLQFRGAIGGAILVIVTGVVVEIIKAWLHL